MRIARFFYVKLLVRQFRYDVSKWLCRWGITKPLMCAAIVRYQTLRYSCHRPALYGAAHCRIHGGEASGRSWKSWWHVTKIARKTYRARSTADTAAVS